MNLTPEQLADLGDAMRSTDDTLSCHDEDRLIHEAGLLAGWDDPSMDVYDDIDPPKE